MFYSLKYCIIELSVKLSSAVGKLKRVSCGSYSSEAARSINVKPYVPNKYKELSLSNFGAFPTGIYGNAGSSMKSGNLISSYNASTGILSCILFANSKSSVSENRIIINYIVYCYYVDI